MKQVRITASLQNLRMKKNHEVFNMLASKHINNNMQVMTCGRLNPDQRLIVKENLRVNVQDYLDLWKWMSENNEHYLHGDNPNEKPEQIIREDKENKNKTDTTIDQTKSKSIEFNFYFSSRGEPIESKGEFEINISFASALLKGECPTSLFHNSKRYFNDKEIDIRKKILHHFHLIMEA